MSEYLAGTWSVEENYLENGGDGDHRGIQTTAYE